jgi:hypothetical protein
MEGTARPAPRRLIAIALAACAIALAGCWNRTPPQQEYFDALRRGNSAQASQLWLQMTPDQRAQFGHGEGIRPSVSHGDVQQAIDEHYSEQDDEGSAPKQVDLAPPGGGLQDLPAYLKSNGADGAEPPPPLGQ